MGEECGMQEVKQASSITRLVWYMIRYVQCLVSDLSHVFRYERKLSTMLQVVSSAVTVIFMQACLLN